MAGLGAHCNAAQPATLAVYVQERDGRGIAGMALRVRWRGGEDRFYSGLKPERGAGYADFTMEQGRRYVIDMPGLSDASPEFETGSCVDEGTADDALLARPVSAGELRSIDSRLSRREQLPGTDEIAILWNCRISGLQAGQPCKSMC